MSDFEKLYNRIHSGDNLEFFRIHVPDNSIGLIYLDPPFNSNRNYNAVKHGNIHYELSYKDTWNWDPAVEKEFNKWIRDDSRLKLPQYLLFREWLEATWKVRLKQDSSMMAYLFFMAPRLLEFHRGLRSNGNIVVHCDPVASPTLREALGYLFGPSGFRSEITWMRSSSHNNTSRRVGNIKDYLIVFGKGERSTFNKTYSPVDMNSFRSHYQQGSDGRWYTLEQLTAPNSANDLSSDSVQPWVANNGKVYNPGNRRWTAPASLAQEYLAMTGFVLEGATIQEKYTKLDSMGLIEHMPGDIPRYKSYATLVDGRVRGKPTQSIWGLQDGDIQDFPQCEVWADINCVNSQANDDALFDGQKPVDLLKRVISLYSDKKDLVVDPFMGSGTTARAARILERNWIGVEKRQDTTAEASRLYAAIFREDCRTGSEISPQSIDEAKDLTWKQLETWVIRDIFHAEVTGKSGDMGQDGFTYTTGWANGLSKKVVIQVKGGSNTKSGKDEISKAGDIMKIHGAEMYFLVAFSDYCQSKSLLSALVRINTKLNDELGVLKTGYPGDVRTFDRVQILPIENHFTGKRVRMLGAKAPGFSHDYEFMEKIHIEHEIKQDCDDLLEELCMESS